MWIRANSDPRRGAIELTPRDGGASADPRGRAGGGTVGAGGPFGGAGDCGGGADRGARGAAAPGDGSHVRDVRRASGASGGEPAGAAAYVAHGLLALARDDARSARVAFDRAVACAPMSGAEIGDAYAQRPYLLLSERNESLRLAARYYGRAAGHVGGPRDEGQLATRRACVLRERAELGNGCTAARQLRQALACSDAAAAALLGAHIGSATVAREVAATATAARADAAVAAALDVRVRVLQDVLDPHVTGCAGVLWRGLHGDRLRGRALRDLGALLPGATGPREVADDVTAITALVDVPRLGRRARVGFETALWPAIAASLPDMDVAPWGPLPRATMALAQTMLEHHRWARPLAVTVVRRVVQDRTMPTEALPEVVNCLALLLQPPGLEGEMVLGMLHDLVDRFCGDAEGERELLGLQPRLLALAATTPDLLRRALAPYARLGGRSGDADVMASCVRFLADAACAVDLAREARPADDIEAGRSLADAAPGLAAPATRALQDLVVHAQRDPRAHAEAGDAAYTALVDLTDSPLPGVAPWAVKRARSPQLAAFRPPSPPP